MSANWTPVSPDELGATNDFLIEWNAQIDVPGQQVLDLGLEALLVPHPEISGVPLVVLDPILAIEVGGDLRRLIEAGYHDAQTWLSERSRAYAQERTRGHRRNRRSWRISKAE